MKAVQSSFIKGISAIPSNSFELTLALPQGNFTYLVPQNIVEGLDNVVTNEGSVGRYYNDFIKGKYPMIEKNPKI